MIYLKEKFILGDLKIHQNFKEAIKDRFFYEFLNHCLDQHSNKSVLRIVKTTFPIPTEFLPLVNFQKTLNISTNTETGKTLVGHIFPNSNQNITIDQDENLVLK